jgi:hypothetical protein
MTAFVLKAGTVARATTPKAMLSTESLFLVAQAERCSTQFDAERTGAVGKKATSLPTGLPRHGCKLLKEQIDNGNQLLISGQPNP